MESIGFSGIVRDLIVDHESDVHKNPSDRRLNVSDADDIKENKK